MLGLLLLADSQAERAGAVHYGRTLLHTEFEDTQLDQSCTGQQIRLMPQPGTTNFAEEDAARVARDLGFALLCVTYLGSEKTQLLGPGTPRPVTPRRGKSGKEELSEPGAATVWEAGVDTGNVLRAYHARKTQGDADPAAPTSTGRRMPPHLREPHLHGYWTGPGRTRYELRFLDFVAVNMDSEGPEAPVRLE